eukprot:4175459-Pleurochrysis_carterae.AAC.2
MRVAFLSTSSLFEYVPRNFNIRVSLHGYTLPFLTTFPPQHAYLSVHGFLYSPVASISRPPSCPLHRSCSARSSRTHVCLIVAHRRTLQATTPPIPYMTVYSLASCFHA